MPKHLMPMPEGAGEADLGRPLPPGLEILFGYLPGAIGRVTELHASYYSRHWDFGLFFEAKVASEMSRFLGRFDPGRDGFWTARLQGRIVGSVTIDGERAGDLGAHLRWFIVSEDCQGQGIGARLLEEAISFCRQRRYGRIYLWTFAGLDAARRLYEGRGFTPAVERLGDQWGRRVKEQMLELFL